jgi:type IV pilus biogenesis protein CpaD/CtpE
MKKQTIKCGLGFVSIALLLGGCAHQYEVEADFGSAVREAIARQTVNPAGVGHDGVTPGMDGASAKATVDRYIRSVEQPPALGDAYRIGVGDSTKGSGVVAAPATR